jgi:hypothetical protein
MVWNTGCRMVGNGLNVGINIQDYEDPHFALTVPSLGSADFNDVIFPWCSNSGEIANKAFAVTNIIAGTRIPFLYLFQDYTNNRIAYSVQVAGQDLWATRMFIGAGVKTAQTQPPLPSVDIFIMDNTVFGLPATTNNAVFQQVFDDAIAVITAGGAIAQAIGQISAAAGAWAAVPAAPAAAAAALSSTPTKTPPHPSTPTKTPPHRRPRPR